MNFRLLLTPFPVADSHAQAKTGVFRVPRHGPFAASRGLLF